MKTIKYLGNYCDGKFVLPKSNAERLLSENPGDLDHPVGEIKFSDTQVDDAVSSAYRAFPSWSSRTIKERVSYLVKFQKILKASGDDLAMLISLEMGKLLKESRAEVDRVHAKVDSARGEEAVLVRSTQHKLGPGLVGKLRFQPRGVLAILAPFNVPAYLACAQIIPALLHGNTVVFKPSELTPFVGQMITQFWNRARLPKGVFNMVQGGGQVGRALVGHPQVDCVVFTGSWATGSKIARQVAQDPHKMCALEMGGKNCAIVSRDANLLNAINETIIGVYMTTGQRCNATSRIAVEKSIAKKFISSFLGRARALQTGYCTDTGAFFGPLVSRGALNHVLMWLNQAPREGFKVLESGGELRTSRRGYYVKPSVHVMEGIPKSVLSESTYTDEEMFGPDVAIHVVRDLEEAIALNNRSHYGLVTSVFTRSKTKFERVLKEAQSGLIHWNVATTRGSGRLPFGGQKRSGNNRPVGFFSPYICTTPTGSVERSRI